MWSVLQSFIKKYVQCYKCGNPETVVKIRKENIFLKCKACGDSSDVDMRHRLNTYILKNPPEDKMSKAEKKCGPSLSSHSLFPNIPAGCMHSRKCCHCPVDSDARCALQDKETGEREGHCSC